MPGPKEVRVEFWPSAVERKVSSAMFGQQQLAELDVCGVKVLE